jgi:thiol-disulfide isomerase/thioredoxin
LTSQNWPPKNGIHSANNGDYMKKQLLTALLITAMAIAGKARAQAVPVWKATDLQTAIDTATVPTIFNFWATFCRPCIAELPHFQTAANRYKSEGVRLVMVSLDLKEAYPKTVSAFAKRLKLTSPVVFLDEADADLFVPLVDASWSGAIPGSLFLNREKGYRRFVEDELSKEKLEEEIKRMVVGG